MQRNTAYFLWVFCDSAMIPDLKREISYQIPVPETGSDKALSDLEKWVDIRKRFNVKDMET